MVKVKEYEVAVSESVMDYIHGGMFSIVEYWVPKEKICFNVVGGDLHVFREEKPRSSKNSKDIEIDEAFVANLSRYLQLQDDLVVATKKLNLKSKPKER